MCVCVGGGGGAPLAVMLEPLLMSPLCVSLLLLFFNIFHLDAYYVCYTMLVQRFEPQGMRFQLSIIIYYYTRKGLNVQLRLKTWYG